MATTTSLTEADILEEVVASHDKAMTPEAAQFFLALKFSRQTTARVRKLLTKNNRGTISADERVALEKYLRVGRFLDLLQARARLALSEYTDGH